MTIDWLEASIEKRVSELVEENEINNLSNYREFSNKINLIKKHLPKAMHRELTEIENMYIDRTTDIPYLYRSGIEDGLNLLKIDLRHN